MPPKSAILCLNTQSRVLPSLSKETRDEEFQPGGSSQSSGCGKGRDASDSLKETRDKDSSLAAALKRWFWQSRALPILSKRPEIRIPAWRQLSNGGSQPDASQKCYFVSYAQKPCVSESVKETRDKDSSLAAALKRWFCQSRLLFPILSKRPGIRIPAWRRLSKRRFSAQMPLQKCYFVA